MSVQYMHNVARMFTKYTITFIFQKILKFHKGKKPDNDLDNTAYAKSLQVPNGDITSRLTKLQNI